jgi:acetate kinase
VLPDPQFIGSYAFCLGGLDAIVFTAAWREFRQSARGGSGGLEHCGIVLDLEKNAATIRGKDGDISAFRIQGAYLCGAHQTRS